MFLAIVLTLAVAQADSTAPFPGEVALRQHLATISQQVGSQHGKQVVADYLTTVDQLRPARQYIAIISQHRQLTIDLWVVKGSTGSPTLPGSYDHVIQLPSTAKMKWSTPSDVYFDFKPIADLEDWLNSAEVKQKVNVRDRDAALLGMRQIRTSAVALITLYKLIDRNVERGLIVAHVDDMPSFTDVMTGLGVTSIIIVQKGAGPPSPSEQEAKRRSS